MTAAWLLIQKFSHRKLLGIPVGRWAVFLTLTLVAFLVLRVLVSAARRRLKARCGLTMPTLNDYLLQLLERTWTLSLLAASAVAALDFGAMRPAEGAGGRGVEAMGRLLALLLIFVQLGVWGTGLIRASAHLNVDTKGFRLTVLCESRRL